MHITREQKRAAILCCNAILLCVLTYGYELYEFTEYTSVLYYRRTIPILAFGLVLSRLVNYGEHVLVNSSKVYTYDPQTGKHTVREEVKAYRSLLVGSYVVVLLTLVVEMWAHAELAILMSLVGVVVLQVAETWAYWLDLTSQRHSKQRPDSPHVMV